MSTLSPPLRFYVIGDPVLHSLSPAMHSAAFAEGNDNATYEKLQIPQSELSARIQELAKDSAVRGINVTVPHKESILPLCDTLTSQAKAIGAVNCIRIEDGRLHGHNTDGDGFVDSIREEHFVPEGKHVVILGTGGSARALHRALREIPEAKISIIGRSKVAWCSSLPWSQESFQTTFPLTDLLVDTTSVGLDDSKSYPVFPPLDELHQAALVCSLVYHRVPRLLADAKAKEFRTMNGMGMLLHQAARSYEFWLDAKAPLEAMRKALFTA